MTKRLHSETLCGIAEVAVHGQQWENIRNPRQRKLFEELLAIPNLVSIRGGTESMMLEVQNRELDLQWHIVSALLQSGVAWTLTPQQAARIGNHAYDDASEHVTPNIIHWTRDLIAALKNHKEKTETQYAQHAEKAARDARDWALAELEWTKELVKRLQQGTRQWGDLNDNDKWWWKALPDGSLHAKVFETEAAHLVAANASQLRSNTGWSGGAASSSDAQ